MDYSIVKGYAVFNGTEDGPSPTTKKELRKLLVELKSKLETDWNVIKEYFKEE